MYGSRNAEQARVAVTVVKGGTIVDAVVLVEDIGVQARIHALAGTASREAAAATEQHLQSSKRVNVIVVNAQSFKGNIDMSEFEVRLRQIQLASAVVRRCGRKFDKL